MHGIKIPQQDFALKMQGAFARGVFAKQSREFLSDAPFFGLSLRTDFMMANCACRHA